MLGPGPGTPACSWEVCLDHQAGTFPRTSCLVGKCAAEVEREQQLHTQVMRVSLCANQRRQMLPSSDEKSSPESLFLSLPFLV